LKLRYSTTSPFVRKCLATAIEAGVVSELELETTNPWDPDTDVTTDNPIGTIPALTLSDGDILFDSPVICEYLDSLRDPPRLFPPEGAARWRALTKMALADGLMDAAILRRREMMRPADEQSPWWVERQHGIVERTVNAMEEQAESYDGIDIGLLTSAISLSYLDFRVPDLAWRDGHPRLSSWYEQFSQRPSIQDTEPHE
jgi:glutathione S-transferase